MSDESRADAGYRVVLASPRWTLNGVNVFNLNLARGLESRGIDTRILLTEESTELVAPTDAPMERPPDLEFDELPVEPWEGWGAHWGATVRYLESLAPCVWVPNYDYRHSCVGPLLSKTVTIVGVVHSDDPLHYEHVGRLGEFWDATVCVSSTLGERTAALCPAIAERVHTIPIGIAIPETRPLRRPDDQRRLRVIYHGVLKQHQKRVLDLPRVIEALEGRGVPVRLTIAGGGPDEAALREACAAQVDRGTIRFLGVVTHDRIPELLRENDVYLLTSEFEGMPNALLEAMANGCVPVVSDMESGIPELVREGESGYLVDIGDTEAFAERLARLQADEPRRERMAAAAYEGVSRGAFSSTDMLEAYIAVFDDTHRRAGAGDFVRPAGEILPPPAQVEGVGVFAPGPGSPAWSRAIHVDGLGTFPSRQDKLDFDRARESPREVDAGRFEVVATVPFWTDNWSNARCHELLRALAERGTTVRLLLTEESTEHVEVVEPRLPLPTEFPVDHLEVGRKEGWGGHWGATLRYLRRHAPCIWLPMHDWRHACVSPLADTGVTVVGLVSDDSLYLEQAARLGHSWDAIVALDATAARALEERRPELAERIRVVRPASHGDPESAGSGYGLHQMARLWVELFDEIERSDGHRGEPGEILPPPAEVGGVGVFPVELTAHIDGIGSFPSRGDHRRFEGQLGRLQALRSLVDRLRH